ncbi:MAG: HAMP domain-containing histidine kinase [Bacteroidales bacterium]|nr:HAMP domain-containing histidine kinase [Bacteroidales bacterium]
MSKKLLILIIVLMSISLSGIIVVQLYWSNNAIKQNEEKFDRKINEILRSVIKKTEKSETAFFIEKEINKAKHQNHKIDISFTNNLNDSLLAINISDSLVNELIILNENFDNNINWEIDTTKNFFKIKNSEKNHNNIRTITEIIENNDSIKTYANSYYISNGKKYSNNNIVIQKKKIKTKAKQINNVIKKMVFEYDADYNTKRMKIKYDLIDSLLKNELKEREIFMPFEYAIISGIYKQNFIYQTKKFNQNSHYKQYSINLFPDDIIPKTDELIIYFPERKTHILKSLSIMFSASVFFIIVILFAFSISIYMIIKQKKISDIKTDFINNMTHEFKTPIATISLAADSVINPKVINDKNRIESFMKIIKDENKRMNLQVEKILQMALLENSDLDLNLEPIDAHLFLQKAVDNIGIQIVEKQGEISTDFLAKNYIINADVMHFSNIINNLLDNAIKYSKDKPKILIKTINVNKGILISIEDNGIGMTKDEITKIFEKFYRVSKGNIHNTKGFGLGLSYVKAIVEALNGKIFVKSEINNGSIFSIYLPVYQQVEI